MSDQLTVLVWVVLIWVPLLLWSIELKLSAILKELKDAETNRMMR